MRLLIALTIVTIFALTPVQVRSEISGNANIGAVLGHHESDDTRQRAITPILGFSLQDKIGRLKISIDEISSGEIVLMNGVRTSFSSIAPGLGYRLTSSVSVRFGETILNQKSFFPANSVVREQSSRLVGTTVSADYAREFKTQTILLEVAASPKMRGEIIGVYPVPGRVFGSVTSEKGQFVDASISLVSNPLRQFALIYGLRYINYSALTRSNIFADRNAGLIPTLGFRIR